MSDRDWYPPPSGGGWGEQPPSQGRDADTRGARQRRSVEDDDYEFVDDRDYRHRALDEQDVEARRRAIFQVQGDGETNNPFPQRDNGPGGGGVLPNHGAPHPNVVFGGRPQGQAEAVAYQAPPHNNPGVPDPQLGRVQWVPPVPPPAQAGAAAPAPPGAPAAHAPPQFATVNVAGGGAIAATGNNPPGEYSGINTALARLSYAMTDTDTARNLKWQAATNGDNAKIDVWKCEAASLPGLQFYAYMQPGDPFLVMGHSLSIIYSTATDVASYHGKMTVFTGDRKATRECVPVFLPPTSAFEWKKCMIIDEKTKLRDFYADNPSEYGKLWDPTRADGVKVEVIVPRMIALPLRAAKIYQDMKGAVMPHELLQAVEDHLASPETTLSNTNEWALVQKWLLVAAQKDGATPKSKSWLAFSTNALLSNEELIHRWIGDRIDATLGRRPDLTPAGGHTVAYPPNNMAAVQNLSGVIAAEVGRGLGAAMQQSWPSKANPTGGTGATEDAKPYTQDQLATLLGFHGAMNVQYLKKMWRLFKSAKVPNYDHIRRALKGEMLHWADNKRSWIEEGVYFDNKTLDEWINLKFNPGDSTALYSSSDRGISILKCRQPTSASLEEMRRQEEIWDATKGNATYVEVVKQAKSQVVCAPAQNFLELRSNVATFCALLFTLFGEGCDLYRSMTDILRILSHPFSGQNKLAYTPEVCRRITWAIIVDTRSFFDDIKLSDDFLRGGGRMQFPVSTLDGVYDAIKHGIKIERHNFPSEWKSTEPPLGYGMQTPYLQGKKAGGGGYTQLPPGVPPQGTWGQALPSKPPPSAPFNWKPANFVDQRHPKFQALMDPLLSKFRGQVSISTILSESGKRFDSLPKLEAYPGGICWLHALSACTFGEACSYAAGHIAQGDLTEVQVDEAVATLQPGVTTLMARPSSPLGKRKYRSRGGGRGSVGGGPPPHPQM